MKMIGNLIIPSIVFLFGICALNAQMAPEKTALGFKIGINRSTLYDDANATDKKKRTGITAGVFAQVPFAKGKMSLRPELLFTTKGGEYVLPSGGRTNFKINYIELPLSLEYRLLSFVNLHAGGYAARIISAKGMTEPNVGSLARANFEKFDYGWLAGAGLDLGSLGIHFRLSRGLKKVGGSQVAPLFGDLKNSTWAITLSLGL